MTPRLGEHPWRAAPQLRRALEPYLTVRCDNLPDNGPTPRRAVLDFARQRDAALAALGA